MKDISIATDFRKNCTDADISILTELTSAIFSSSGFEDAVTISLSLLKTQFDKYSFFFFEVDNENILRWPEYFEKNDGTNGIFEVKLPAEKIDDLRDGNDCAIGIMENSELNPLTKTGIESLRLFPVSGPSETLFCCCIGIFNTRDIDENLLNICRHTVQLLEIYIKNHDEKKLLEEKISHYNKAVANSGICSWSWNIKTGYIRWSDTIEALFGISRSELEGNFETVLSYVHPDDKQMVLDVLNKVFEKGGDTYFEYRIILPDGQYRWVAQRGNIEYDKEDNPSFMYGVVSDITERKEAELGLAKSTKLWDLVINTWSDHILTLDTDLVIQDVTNPSSKYTSNELIGTCVLDYLPKDQKIFVESILLKILKDGNPAVYETNLELKESGERYYETAAVALRENDRIIGLTLNTRDITVRKKTEIALKHHSLLIQNVSDAVVAIGLDFKIKSWNKSAERIYGYTAEETIGKHTGKVLKTRYQDGLTRKDILKMLEKEDYWHGEVIQTTKSGKEIVADYSLSMIRDENGKPLEVVATGNDISELAKRRKEIERQKIIFESVIMTISDVVVITNLNREIIKVNNSVKKVFGYEPRELIGEKTAILYAKEGDFEQQGKDRYHVGSQIQAKHDQIYEMYYRRKNGEIFVGETLGCPYKTAEGETLGFLGVIRDISERKNNQIELNARVLELNSLYNLDRMTEETEDLDDIFRRFINEIVPESMKGTIGVVTELIVDNASYGYGIIKHANLLQETIFAGGKERGTLKIGFADEEYVYDEYENNLIRAFAERLGIILERSESRKELEESRKLLSERVKERTRDLTSINKRLLIEISERKKVEERLRLTEISVDNSAVSTFWTNDHGQIIHANNAASELVGMSRETLLTLSIQDVLENFDYSDWKRVWNGLKKKKHYHSDSMFVSNDAVAVPVETTFNYLEYNSVDYCFLFVRDISARKEAEKKVKYHLHLEAAISEISKKFLGLEKADLEEVVEVIGETLDNDRVFMSRKTEDNARLKLQHVWCSKTISQEIANDLKEIPLDSLEWLRSKFIGKETIVINDTSELPDGARTEREDMVKFGIKSLVLIPIVLKNGNVWGCLGVDSINLQRNWYDFEIRFLQVICSMISTFIEQQISEEERVFLEQQLFHAQKMESIGRLAGGIAHDFNNILTGILGYSELLQSMFNDTGTPEGEAAEFITDSARRASRLTGQLLAFARKGDFKVKPENLNRIIEKTVKVSEKIFEKKIILKTELDPDLSNVEVDDSQFEQVLTNLLINAKDALPNGGQVTIETRNVELGKRDRKKFVDLIPGKYVQMVLSDDGIGMEPEVLNRMFEPFFTTKEEGKGTGLGMSMVYGIIKKHDGYIDVSSTPGVGTTFYFYIPVTEKEIVFDRIEDAIPAGDATVLLIDDELPVRNVVSSLLKRAGFHVFTAKSGIDGIAKYKSNIDDIDIVLLDIVMPGLDGKQTYQKLKEINPEARILFLSGYSDDNTISELLESGASGFLEKPVVFSDLISKINSILDSENNDFIALSDRALGNIPADRSIMIIDDEEINTRQLSDFLNVLGYRVLTSNSAREGFETVIENSCSIVILDINMPIISGFELLEMFNEYYASDKSNSPQFIVVTGQDPEEIRLRCEDAGARQVIGKPVDLHHLVDIIEKIVIN